MDTFAIISGLASIIGIPLAITIAIIQTNRLKGIKQREYRDTWKLVRDVRALMTKTKAMADNNKDDGAHELSKSIYRHLIKNAVELEKDFNKNTIESWIENERINDTPWQRGIAKSYLGNKLK